jgi:hypothetical protein
MLSLKTEVDVLHETADLLRSHRLASRWRQEDLAVRSGLAIATLRRFEHTGQIGFRGLSKLLITMGLADHFLSCFKRPTESEAPKTIEAFLAAGRPVKRPQRVRVAKTTSPV